MRHLWDDLDSFRGRFVGQPIDLFLDYDGTLTPIAETPQQALLSSTSREVLLKLSRLPQVQLTIVSGRALEDVRRMVGIKDLIYVGNHGFEIRGHGMEFEGLISPEFKRLMAALKTQIVDAAGGFSGVFIEDKGLTMSVHYRLAESDRHNEILIMLEKVTRSYVANKEIRVMTGKKVFEIRPPIDWDKGKAVLWIIKRHLFEQHEQDRLAIYIGDDLTDEDAFLAVKDRGIAVCVGKREVSHATHYLIDPDEVIEFLEELYHVRNKDQ